MIINRQQRNIDWNNGISTVLSVVVFLCLMTSYLTTYESNINIIFSITSEKINSLIYQKTNKHMRLKKDEPNLSIQLFLHYPSYNHSTNHRL